MSKVTTERRAHARHRRPLELEGAPVGGKAARMQARDLSLGGLYCTSPVGFDEMTRLEVRLLLPSGRVAGRSRTIDLEAVVVRRRELDDRAGAERYELALFFTKIGDDQRARLARFLAS